MILLRKKNLEHNSIHMYFLVHIDYINGIEDWLMDMLLQPLLLLILHVCLNNLEFLNHNLHENDYHTNQ